ncbi:MAG: acyl-CoA thioesterase [Dethiobacter sp.]|jgi:acyl-CoA hydrolase|nr:acyl-CoA thioesterase [Dethiobacter sp.]
MKSYQVNRLIKSEDLNHHGTLFAGRMAEWFVECAFIAAASLYRKPEGIVCLKIHGMHFTKPVQKGDIIKLESKVVRTGNSSMQAYVKAVKNEEPDSYLEGFITFITVDEQGNKVLHNVPAQKAETEEERKLAELAGQIVKTRS